MTAEERRLTKAAKQARESTKERDDRIRALAADGYTLRRIGELAGLSHTAIAKICTR